jgi:hypothetical protein
VKGEPGTCTGVTAEVTAGWKVPSVSPARTASAVVVHRARHIRDLGRRAFTKTDGNLVCLNGLPLSLIGSTVGENSPRNNAHVRGSLVAAAEPDVRPRFWPCTRHRWPGRGSAAKLNEGLDILTTISGIVRSEQAFVLAHARGRTFAASRVLELPPVAAMRQST